ncbi:MAG: hypothetical protein DRJ03_07630 [Chloroflexi bacterium]|nr:MAG: hypothetical protein DRJ03_07630 [Chloroflexota bacterium]
MWKRKQYEDAALQIAKDFTASEGTSTINELSTKVARDNNLDAEGIRTMVRLANVSAFQELFSKKASDGDRMIEYDLGDPEMVVSTLYAETKEKVASAGDMSSSSSGYDRHLDYFGALEKIAEEDEEEESSEESDSDAPMVDKKKIKHLFGKAKKKMEEQEKEARASWMRNMEDASQTLRVVGVESSFNKEAFDRDAICLVGDDVLPELRALNLFTRGDKDLPVAGNIKTAHIRDMHVVVPNTHTDQLLKFIKEAHAARLRANEWAEGVLLLEAEGIK